MESLPGAARCCRRACLGRGGGCPVGGGAACRGRGRAASAAGLLPQGEVQALFLRHEGYLGAIGAFLKGAEQDSEWARPGGGEREAGGASEGS